MKRLFIGIRTNPDKKFMELYSSLRKELEGESIKWTPADNIHLTLVFLGQTDESRIPSIKEVLQHVSSDKKRFDISLRGFGVFKSLSDPKVLWAGVYPSDLLASLQGEIAGGLREKGFSIEEKPFSPHVTAGRIKNIRDKDAFRIILLKYHSTDIQQVHVSEVILFESITRQEGPVYKPLAVFGLL
jgi:2'-5' RNA ligase